MPPLRPERRAKRTLGRSTALQSLAHPAALPTVQLLHDGVRAPSLKPAPDTRGLESAFGHCLRIADPYARPAVMEEAVQTTQVNGTARLKRTQGMVRPPVFSASIFFFIDGVRIRSA